MPFDAIAKQTDSLDALSDMPEDSPDMDMDMSMDMAPNSPMDAQGGIQGSGGPGIDTPAEQKAVKLFIQGMQMIRQGAHADPSTKAIIDKFLQDAFLQLSAHYGYGEEGKMALKQSQMLQTKARGASLAKPPTSGPMGAPQAPAGPPNMSIQY